MEQNVTTNIPDKTNWKINSKEHLYVCAYCRVSTQQEDQCNSLESQKEFFDKYFKDNNNWENVGIFADEGLSGTSYRKRDEFIRMLHLARKKKIDIILTKDVSRFSRNIADFKAIVKELKDIGVYIWFLADDLYTEDNNILEKLNNAAMQAENESIKTSRRVIWGQQRKMEKGVVFGRKEMFGYNIIKDATGKQFFEIIEEEAQIIKNIFEWFANGDGTYRIARRLESLGVKTKRYKNGWTNTVILRILRNEKYVGDLLQGKTWTPDPLTHAKKYNKENAYSCQIENHHPESAIIDRDLWDRVQKKLAEKAPSDEVKAKHSNRYWTSGKVFCGICGGRYVNYTKKQKSGEYKAWVCFENHQRGKRKEIAFGDETITVGCDGKRVNDRVLKMAVHDIISEYLKAKKDEICNKILKEIKKKSVPKDNSNDIKCQKNLLKVKEDNLYSLTMNLTSGSITQLAYSISANRIENEIAEIKQKINKLENQDRKDSETSRTYENYLQQIKSIVELTDEQINEELFERITKKIVIYPNNVLVIYLSFLLEPVIMRYQTSGKLENYRILFDIIDSIPQSSE